MRRKAALHALTTPVIRHVNMSSGAHHIPNLPRGKYVVCGEAMEDGFVYQSDCSEIVVEKIKTNSKTDIIIVIQVD